jgi:hypothetical protein
MENEFVSYEQAVALKELGFDERCLGWYSSFDKLLEIGNVRHSFYTLAPIKQQAFRWFREKGYSFNIMADNAILNSNYFYDIWYNTKFMIETDYDYSTYEEAENACIDKLIELSKQLNNA